MKLHVLHGDDTDAIARRRTELLQFEGFREEADCAEDAGKAVVAAAECPSMFGDIRLIAVENFELTNEENVQRLVEAASASDAVIVARCTTLPAAFSKKLNGVATIEKFVLAKGRDAAGRVTEIAREEGVTLSGPQRMMLIERCGDNLERVRSICWQLSMVGSTTPSDRQLDVLLGSASRDGVPWNVTDALRDGDVKRALEALEGLEAMPVLAYLMNTVSNCGRVLEHGCKNSKDVELLLGQKSFQAGQTLELSKRLGLSGVKKAAQVLVQAELDAKSSVGADAALALAVCAIAPLWAVRRA
jgi:DNA polymerase III delta subunit